MLRVYDLRKDLNNREVVILDVYHFRGSVPHLTIRHWINTGKYELNIGSTCPPFHAEEELRKFVQLFETQHWRNFIMSECLQEHSSTATSSLFGDLID